MDRKGNKMRKILIVLSVMMLVMGFGITAFAAPSKDTVVALGADLTAQQRATVLELMELTEEDLAECTVITITNEMEHQYLDAYIDPSVIGTKSLSSVVLRKADKGNGVLVTTKNINYCTTGMYRNALLTAGLEDTDVLVVGPSKISGTAALIGAVKAYEQVSGEGVSDKVLDTAMDEMITTGELAAGENNEEIEELIAFIKAKLAAGELTTDQDIQEAIKEGEEKFSVSLTDEEKEKILQVMHKIKELGLDPEKLLDQAKDLYAKFGDELINNAEEVIKNSFKESVSNFFTDMGSTVKNFFSNLFS